MRFAKPVLIAAALAVAAACAVYSPNPRMTYYHGPNVPDAYITIVRAAPDEIRFEIRVEFVPKQMYHLILDGEDPVAQGWFSTLRAGGQSYTATLRPAAGRTFEAGKTYRLCIGAQNPQAVQMTSSNYECQAEYTFVFTPTK